MLKKFNLKKSTYYFIFVITAVVIIISVLFLFNINKKLTYAYFYKGIYVDGVNIAGMTKSQALEEIQQEFENKYYKESVSLVYDQKTWKIPLKSIDFSFDYKGALDYAYKIGHGGTWFERLKAIRELKKNPVNLIISGKFDREKLIDKLNIIKKEIDFSGTSSTYDYNYGRINYTQDISGNFLDIETNEKLIGTKLLNRDFSDIYLEVRIVKPLITVKDVKDIKDVLSAFTTNFNKNNYSRAHNIELAGKKINNYLLLPGEEFSMDLALGPRTSGNGYLQAPIIMKSQVVPGTGGGVCQVATTLYNAALLSLLPVTMRVSHSIPLGYVPPGRDATISEGYIDLKFKNNRDYTICIAAEIKGGSITVKIIGKRKGDEPQVALRSVIVDEYHPPGPEYVVNDSLPDNTVRVTVKERRGLKVIVYRDTYHHGALIDSEVISEDIYKPVREQRAVNRKTFESLRSN